MRTDSGRILDGLRRGTIRLDALLAPDGGRYAILRGLAGAPGLLDLWRFKADLVVELLTLARGALPGSMRLMPQAFPPPWSLVSGFDYARAGAIAQAIGVKLYTMHWPMMARFYADALPDTDARTVTALLDTGARPLGVDDLRYPEPDEPHPVGGEAQARKLAHAVAEAGECPVYAFAHSYGPLDDVLARFEIAWKAPTAGVWVNRYGYLSDAKIEAIGRVVSGDRP